MTDNIEITTPTVKPDVFHTESLAAHAAEIRRLGKRLITDVIEIGRHLTEVRAELRETVGHGHFHAWIGQEFGWSDRTTLNFMRVYELSLKSETVSDLNLPMRELYLLAAPSTPEEAVNEIIERAAAGEPMFGAEVKEIIAKAKGIDADFDRPRRLDGVAGDRACSRVRRRRRRGCRARAGRRRA